MTPEQKKQYDEWVSTRPIEIQELSKKYPPGEYVIKEGAPYTISCPGTKVYLHSYILDGNVTVVVMAKDKLPAAIEHEKILGAQYHKTEKQLQKIHESNVEIEIDPIWIDLIVNYTELK